MIIYKSSLCRRIYFVIISYFKITIKMSNLQTTDHLWGSVCWIGKVTSHFGLFPFQDWNGTLWGQGLPL